MRPLERSASNGATHDDDDGRPAAQRKGPAEEARNGRSREGRGIRAQDGGGRGRKESAVGPIREALRSFGRGADEARRGDHPARGGKWAHRSLRRTLSQQALHRPWTRHQSGGARLGKDADWIAEGALWLLGEASASARLQAQGPDRRFPGRHAGRYRPHTDLALTRVADWQLGSGAGLNAFSTGTRWRPGPVRAASWPAVASPRSERPPLRRVRANP